MAKGSLLRKRYTSQFCTKYYPFLLKDYTQSGCSKNHILAATTIVKIFIGIKNVKKTIDQIGT